MSIFYNKQKNTITLNTKHTTYQMKIDKFGVLLHLYYGPRTVDEDMSWMLTYADRGFSGNPYEAGMDRTYSYDVLPQELPTQGTGDYRSTALIVRSEEGAYGCVLKFVSCEILKGKYALNGLPAAYASEEEAETLKITLKDEILGLQAELFYGVFHDTDVITRAMVITNTAEQKFTLDKVQTAVLDMLSGEYDLITFHGRHAMERNMQRASIAHGEFSIGSRRGMSSHQYNPFVIMARQDATEDFGDCYAMEFVYSGSFKAEAGHDYAGQTRLQMGLCDDQFSYPLNAGEKFTAPEVILSYSANGIGQLSRNLHDFIRNHIAAEKYKEESRPILLNSWEASYFDFTGESLLKLAREAKELGIEMLVMDDGWFGDRNDDYRALGDWKVNEDKLGMTLGELSDKVHELGLKFGIWFEPEMINEDSDLFRKHPDYAFILPGRKPIRSRNQLVLDFSRKEVVDCVYEMMCEVLDHAKIEYLKWDYNRGISDVYSCEAEDQGKVLYDYILGLYDLLDRLIHRYPDMMIEGCSGGGGRFDAGMMYYTPQIWCSDNSDAIDRLRIQYGTSFGYPSSTVGAHVSVCPNEQNGRITPLHTRGVVAMGGTFGYELDPAEMSEEEKEEVREQIKTFKKLESLILTGDYFRLSNPFTEEFCAWEMASKDRKEIMVSAVTLTTHGNRQTDYVRFKDLLPGMIYVDQNSGKRYSAEALMQVGMPLPLEFGEYKAYTYHLTAIS